MSGLIKIPVILMSMLLSACATFGPGNELFSDGGSSQRRVYLQSLTDWQLDGRVAIKSDEGSGKLGIRWQQSADGFAISLMSFLGQQVANIQVDSDGQVSLYRPGQAVVSAANSEVILADEFGWHLPLNGLHYWVRGVPVPEHEGRESHDSAGRLLTLEQDGWSIEYTAYQQVKGVYLPRKMRLTHPLLSARLVLDRWQFDAPDVGQSVRQSVQQTTVIR